ncbi:MAG: hypothetical protein EA412_08500 [Chitinophagaceae bacterium]|nr:MAG: hypothetical protein EA412_08500 [Chitinophagaceae bacterium]
MYWEKIFGLITSGMYLLGSVLVFIIILWNKDFSVLLIVTSVTGFLIGLGYIFVFLKNRDTK